VEHSEALRRVVRAGSRGTIGPERGKTKSNVFFFVSSTRGCDYTKEDATDYGRGMRLRIGFLMMRNF
jgi:hypothetical protein